MIKPLTLRTSIEQLEARDNPSTAATVVYTQAFDQILAPALPSGWTNWSSDGQQQYITSKLASASSPNALSSVGGKNVQTRFWYQSTFGPDFGSAISARIDSPAPVEVIARGQSLNSTRPSYISATVRFGGQVDLVEVKNGVRTALGTVFPVGGLYSGWVRVSLKPSGDTANVQVQRLDTKAFLNAAGTWQAAETDVIQKKVTPATLNGVLGVGRVPGNGGSAFLDDFTILAPPTVNEAFDTTAVGAIPTGWQTWSSDASGSVKVGNAKSLTPGNGLSATGNSPTTIRAWVSNGMPADARATVSVFAGSLVPGGVFVRGSSLDTAKPTYYEATVTRGVGVQVKKVVSGVETVLATTKSTAYTSQLWVQVTLVARGSQLQTIVYRPDTKQWLGTDGSWKNNAEAALTVRDTSITTGGQVGVERVRSSSGTIWFDNFEVRAAGAVVTPTISVLRSQSGTVTGTASFAASATSATPIVRVDFVLNGVLRSSQNVGNAKWELDTTTITNGRHELVIRAVDMDGNVGSSTVGFDVANVAAPPRLPASPDVRKYKHIRIAQLAYSGNPMGTFEQTLATNSLDLVVANPRFLSKLESVAPTTPTIIYTNLSNIYGDLLTSWLGYADSFGVSREAAFFHVTQPTAFSGSSASAQPVNWLWNASLASADGTGVATDLTANARGGRLQGSAFGGIGQALSLGYTDRFRELNFTISRSAGAGWQSVFEYVSKVDANGKPTEWKALALLTDSTNSFRNDGRVTFDPPAGWVASNNPNGTDRLFQIRIRTVAGTVATAPEAKTILGRDYVNANGTQAGVIPVFDSTADINGDGYLTDAEYASRRTGFDARFDYESRLFYPHYGQMRFVTNPNPPAIQKWAGDFHAALLPKFPQADGFFIDNAHGKVPFTGTPVRESTTSFTADSAAIVATVTKRLSSKWVIANTSGSRAEGNPITAAATGAYEEFLLRPNDTNWTGFLDVVALVNSRLAASPTAYVILDSHPGSLPTTDDRTRSSTLAYYYLVGDPNRTFINFYGGYSPSAAWSSVWVPAAATDVGQPTGAMTVFQTGQDPANAALRYQIFRRDYGNAIVLFKPLSYTLGKGTGTNSDATATNVNLGGSYRVLHADGTLGPVITQISLRNAEGVVLMKA